jgi:hypothetical protein
MKRLFFLFGIFPLFAGFLLCPAGLFSQELLVDFGASAGQNIYNTTQFPGWNNVTLSSTTGYVQDGNISGTDLLSVPSDSNQYSSYTCISGNARPFPYGTRLFITWQNTTNGDISFNPLISFVDSDNPVNTPGEPNWFIAGKLSDFYVWAHDSITIVYDMTNSITSGPMVPPSEGTWSLINICVNRIDPGLILDRIEIGLADTVAPAIPGNLHVTGSSSKSISLAWDAVSDNSGGDGFLKYVIWDGVQPFGTCDTNVYTAFELESGTPHSFQLQSMDIPRNTSALSAPVQASTQSFATSDSIINPYTDLQYMGAFLMPSGGTGSSFNWMDGDLAFYPGGDPGNSDGFPGSLFVPGDGSTRYVCEISIPPPVISATHDVNDLPEATFLQDFYDIRSPNVPVIYGSWTKGPSLEYLPAQSGQTQDYLYTCFGDYYMWGGERLKSFGASSIDLANANPYGGWYLGSEIPYSEPYYMTTISFIFDLPYEINNHLLVAGGHRIGDVHHGPTLMAYSPWNDATPLPGDDAHLSFTPLLMYETDAGTHWIEGHEYCDVWYGGSWLTHEDNSAIIISGRKARGLSWYGHVNGESTFNVMMNVPTPEEPDDHMPQQSHFTSLLLFYKPADLLNVVNGSLQTYEPQPYAVLDIQDLMIYPNQNGPAYGSKFRGPGGMTFDRQNGIIYMLEQNATGPDTTVSIVHVWKVINGTGLNDSKPKENIKIYNWSNSIYIEFAAIQDAKAEIINITGSVLQSADIIGQESYTLTADVPGGIYFVRVTGKDQVTTKMIVIE